MHMTFNLLADMIVSINMIFLVIAIGIGYVHVVVRQGHRHIISVIKVDTARQFNSTDNTK